MLEIPCLLQDENESFTELPEKFHITKLKNGNYALSNIEDIDKLTDVLKGWWKQHIHQFDLKNK